MAENLGGVWVIAPVNDSRTDKITEYPFSEPKTDSHGVIFTICSASEKFLILALLVEFFRGEML